MIARLQHSQRLVASCPCRSSRLTVRRTKSLSKESQNELHEYHDELGELPEKLYAAQTERDVLWHQCDSQLHDLQGVDELLRERNEHMQAADSANEALDECEEALRVCQQEFDECKHEKEQLERDMAVSTNEFEECREQLDASQASQGQFQVAYQKDLDACRQALQDCDTERHWLQQELKAHQQAVPGVQSELEARQKETDQLRKQCWAVSHELEAANNALLQQVGSNNALAEYDQRLKHSRANQEQQQQQLAVLTEQLKDQSDELQGCQKQRDRLQQQCDAYEQEKDGQRACHGAMEEALSEGLSPLHVPSPDPLRKWSPGAKNAVTAALWRVAEDEPQLLTKIPGLNQMQIVAKDVNGLAPQLDRAPWFKGQAAPGADSAWFTGKPQMTSPYN